MSTDSELSGALRGATREVSLKDLRRRKVDTVRVIERSKLEQALALLAAEGTAQTVGKGESVDKKRIVMLLQEVERLGQAKSSLEHDKGLLEAERSQLRADWDVVCAEAARDGAQKLRPADVRALADEARRLREEKDKTQRALDRMQQQAQARIDEELGKTQRLSLERDTVATERARAQEALDDERRLRGQVQAELDEARREIGRQVEAVTRSRAEQEDLLAEIDTLREERASLSADLRAARESSERLRAREQEQGALLGALEDEARRLRGELEALRAAQPPAPPEPAPRAPSTSHGAAKTNPTIGFGFGGAGRGRSTR